jgi:hypothetical protein
MGQSGAPAQSEDNLRRGHSQNCVDGGEGSPSSEGVTRLRSLRTTWDLKGCEQVIELGADGCNVHDEGVDLGDDGLSLS